MVGAYIILGTILAFMLAIAALDYLGRRQERRERRH